MRRSFSPLGFTRTADRAARLGAAALALLGVLVALWLPLPADAAAAPRTPGAAAPAAQAAETAPAAETAEAVVSWC